MLIFKQMSKIRKNDCNMKSAIIHTKDLTKKEPAKTKVEH
jgi:hypothetical protein